MILTRRFTALFTLTLLLLFTAFAVAQEDDQISIDAMANAHVKHNNPSPHAHANGQAHARFGVPNIDSLVNFNGHYFTNGFDSNGNPQREWFYNTVGNPPQMHGTTYINAPIVPVTIDLRNFDGSPRFVNGQPLVSSPAAFVTPVVNSPVFSNATFSTSKVPTQVNDAAQRAEYWQKAKDDWHTILVPQVKTGRTMVLLRGTYSFVLNADGTCCRYILVDYNTFANKLFPATADDTTTPIGAAENAGDITTKDMSTFLFPNVFLSGSFGCCVIGFHSYDFEFGTPDNGNVEKRYVLNYSSWISPGIFGGGFQDVTALSHEIAETYNDPFVASDNVRNITPWWLAPNSNCQNDLETGDVIEGLPNGVFPITMNGMTYHPQNEALLQWFEFESPSSAFGNAYSYPDLTTLTALSPVQKPGCAP
jgi:hypothetical protein